MRANIGSCLVGLSVLGISFVGCGRSTKVATDEAERMVYVDTKTMQAMVLAVADETPAVNPATGKRTLMPALYCPSCRRWHPVPPLEQINHVPGAAQCRKTGAALTANGPWPE